MHAAAQVVLVGAEVGMAGGLCGAAVVGVGERREDSADSGVQHRAPGGRQSPIGGAAHEVVHEVDVAVIVGAQHAVAFQDADRFEQLDRFAFDEPGQHTWRYTATESGDPWHQAAGAARQVGPGDRR